MIKQSIKLLLIFIILISCRAIKKDLTKSKEEEKLETREIVKTDIKENNDIIINTKNEINNKELQFTVTPLLVDSTKGDNEITIIDNNGKQTKLKYPKNSIINFGSKDIKETKTEDKKDKSKKEVSTLNNSYNKSSKSNENKKLKLDKEEPFGFNITIAIFICIIILIVIGYIYYRYKIIKRNTNLLK